MTTVPEAHTGSEEPLYNIGVVARMTGLSMATLRAWERRYEFPASERTSGGHRLYSERDVIRLRWVKARISDGMQTAQAIHALQRQEETGKLQLIEPVYTGLERMAVGTHLEVFRDQLIEALLQRDLERADGLLADASTVAAPENLILDVISPAIAATGDAWEAGQISVTTEHLATNYLRQRLLLWMLSGPPPKSMSPIVLACAPNEWHEGSLLILGAILRRRRWPIAYLGQAVPLVDLAGFVRDLRPPLVVAIAMTEAAAAELIEWPKWMPDTIKTGRPILGYGGRIFVQQPEWRMRMQGLYLGSTFQEGLNTIERLL